jgi:hypothetical protein
MKLTVSSTDGSIMYRGTVKKRTFTTKNIYKFDEDRSDRIFTFGSPLYKYFYGIATKLALTVEGWNWIGTTVRSQGRKVCKVLVTVRALYFVFPSPYLIEESLLQLLIVIYMIYIFYYIIDETNCKIEWYADVLF